jgi:hypothetical protein
MGQATPSSADGTTAASAGWLRDYGEIPTSGVSIAVGALAALGFGLLVAERVAGTAGHVLSSRST